MTDTFRREYTPLDEGQKQLVLAVKEKAEEMLILLNGKGVGASREGALAKTKLEECVMWAVKGITA